MAKNHQRAKHHSPPSPAKNPASPQDHWLGIALGYFALATVSASLFAPRTFWSLASPSFFPPGWVIPALALAGVGFLGYADRGLSRLLSSKQASWIVIVLCAGLVAAAWFTRMKLNWLGDQSLWIRDIDRDRIYHPIEPLSWQLVELGHAHLSSLAAKEGERVLSVLLGGLFFFMAWLLSSELLRDNPQRRTFLWACMVAVPQRLFYFGYVESYPYFLLALMLLAWLTLRSSRRGGFFFSWISVLLAASTHLFGIGALAAVSVAAWLRGKRLAVAVALVLTLGLFAAWLLHINVQAAYFTNDYRTTLTVFDQSKLGWPRFLSWGHVRGIFNIVLLTGGPALWVALFLPWRTLWRSHRRTILVLLLLAAPGIGGLLFLRMLLGAPRDWDLFSSYLYCIPLLILWAWLKSTPGRGLPRFAAALLMLNLLHAFFWISVDADRDRGLRRAVLLYGSESLEPRKAVSKAAEELGILERDQGNFDSALGWFQVSIDRVPSHWRYYSLFADTASRKGDFELAKEYYLKSIDRKPTRPGPYANLGQIYLSQNDAESALRLYRKAQHERGEHPDWYLGIGSAYSMQAKHQEAIAVLDSSIARYPESTLAYLQRGAARYYANDAQGAIQDLRYGLISHPGRVQGWILLEAAANKTGDQELAAAAKQRGAALMKPAP